jgi:hypothetical protein
MTLNDLAKRIAAQLKLKNSVVRAVLMAKGSPQALKKVLVEAELSEAMVRQITEAARTLIHDELMRLDAQHHPEGPKFSSRRGETAAPRRSR